MEVSRDPSTTRATPKSVSLAVPSDARRMLGDLMSR